MSELTEPTPGPPQFDAASVWAVPPDLLPAAPRNRTWLRTALRWTTAVVVCAAVGTGTAFAVMAPRRTDIPGLRTPTDGRYVFPALTLPALPSGAVGPAEGSTGSDEGLHAADLRKLLLAAPVGAQVDASYPGASGWYPVATFGQKFGYVPTLAQRLQDDGARHVAATAWKGPDGTRTEILLVQLRSYNTASDLYQLVCGTAPDLAPNAVTDPAFALPDVSGGTLYTSRAGDAQPGHAAARITCVQSGDVAAVIVMTNPVRVNPVVTEQVATLQAELLLG
jgi:hypothetical protein